VSPSSVYAWTNDIVLTPEQVERNLTGPTGPQNPEHIAARMAAWSARNRTRREGFQEAGRRRARDASDLLHLAGCMLYWAEGSKDRNTLKFANSDPQMVRFFAQFLRTCLGVARTEFTVRLNVYLNNGMSIEEIESFWLDNPRLAADVSAQALAQFDAYLEQWG
jgi:hypothetical protein